MPRETFQCPVCDMHRPMPTWPDTAGASWGDCACSDRSTCVSHQVDPTGFPFRPSEEILRFRAEEDLRYRLARWQEWRAKALQFERAEQRIKALEDQVRELQMALWEKSR